MGFKVSPLPMKYLGLPIGAPLISLMIWSVIEKIQRRLTSWKSIYLSNRVELRWLGAHCLIFLFFSLFHLPARVSNRIVRVFRNLLRDNYGEERKFHSRSWNKVCFSNFLWRFGNLKFKTFYQSCTWEMSMVIPPSKGCALEKFFFF